MKETYKVTYAPAALDDLKSIFSYIAHEIKAEQAAKNQIARIRKEIRSLDRMPERFSKVDWEPWASMDMRKLPVDNYIIYYLVDQERQSVTIIRIFYGGRDVRGIIHSQIESF